MSDQVNAYDIIWVISFKRLEGLLKTHRIYYSINLFFHSMSPLNKIRQSFINPEENSDCQTEPPWFTWWGASVKGYFYWILLP